MKSGSLSEEIQNIRSIIRSKVDSKPINVRNMSGNLSRFGKFILYEEHRFSALSNYHLQMMSLAVVNIQAVLHGHWDTSTLEFSLHQDQLPIDHCQDLDITTSRCNRVASTLTVQFPESKFNCYQPTHKQITRPYENRHYLCIVFFVIFENRDQIAFFP